MIYTTILFGLMLKHAFVDLFLQSCYKPSDKTRYLNGIRHYIDHGVGTALVVFVFTFDVWASLIVGVVDFVVHSAIDHYKSRLVKHLGWNRNEPRFWKLQSLDQALHYVTYFVIVLLLANQSWLVQI